MTDEILRVVVVDDQPVVRSGLRAMLDAESDIDVVGAAADGVEAIELSATARPDVVLMDIRMPRMDGVAAARRILRDQTARAVVMITTFDDEDYLLDSVRAGACGFLLKDAGPDLLAAAVRRAILGDALIDPAMTRRLLEGRLAAPTPEAALAPEFAQRLASLTDREREMLTALTRGSSNADMAAEFFVSEATIKTHVGRILTKTGVRSRVGAAVFAYESGFVRPAWSGDPAAPPATP